MIIRYSTYSVSKLLKYALNYSLSYITSTDDSTFFLLGSPEALTYSQEENETLNYRLRVPRDLNKKKIESSL